MKRLLIASAVLMAVTAIATMSPAGAQANGLCTQRVYDDMSDYTIDSGDLNELTSTMNRLAAEGVEPHAVFLDTLGTGVADVPQYEREILRDQCPELFVGTEPKPDLFMLVVSADRQMGTVFGSDLSGVHSFDDYTATAADHFRDGDFARGLDTYFELVHNRLEGGDTEATAGPSVNWSALWRFAAMILGLPVVAVGVVRAAMRIRAARARRARRSELVEGFDAARADYHDVHTRSTHTIEAAQLWADRLPESDEADLISGLSAWRRAFDEEATGLFHDTGDRIRAARSRQDLDAAERQLKRFRAAITTASLAVDGLDAATTDLEDTEARFSYQSDSASAALRAAEQLLETRAAEGFNVDLAADRHAGARDRYNEALQAFDRHAIRTATSAVDQVAVDAQELADTLARLPGRRDPIVTMATELRDRISNLISNHVPKAADCLDGLKRDYATVNWGDLVDHADMALATFRAAESELDRAEERAELRDLAAFDEADRCIDTAAAKMTDAADLMHTVTERRRTLDHLAESLPQDLAELSADIDGLEAFIAGADAGFVSSSTISAVAVLRARARALTDGLAGDPLYLRLAKDVAELRDAVTKAHRDAQTEHDEAARRVEKARRRAERRLRDAARYRTHARSWCDEADGFFTGALVGMTLDQQLAHWSNAHQAADQAYRYGFRSYERANTSRSTFSSSGGSDGGSWGAGGSSRRSYSGGSDGGSW